KGDAICSIDALKSTSDVYAPVAGEIIEVNEMLAHDNAKIINTDPLGAGWLCVMTIDDESQLGDLLSESEYREYVR
ncbi:MAG TPA: glycine cleavage system protein H, partial [Spirochaetia bacterium]|nr:glycine cleavage system protein H [Spirochaetia bacterium]